MIWVGQFQHKQQFQLLFSSFYLAFSLLDSFLRVNASLEFTLGVHTWSSHLEFTLGVHTLVFHQVAQTKMKA